ncbi:hypothetical protein [Burkholderia sp. S171]|uniref:hypothetical protein n=1 Tax=Burkholderia sp. S171 TaxID=1641860 RepID=UPI00131AB410|nr:hypothetical protein [Burkholderia sp. S171]
MFIPILGVFVLLAWVAVLHRKIARLDAEILARRTYDNERNLRILWANERDACDEAGDPDSFYETYGKHVSRQELDIDADLGAIERGGNGYFGLVRTPEQIVRGRQHYEARGKRMREAYHKNEKLSAADD